MLGAKAAIGRRRRRRKYGHERRRDDFGYQKSAGATSAACVVVLVCAAVALVGPPVLRGVVEIGISLVALGGAWVLRDRFKQESELRRTVADAAAARERRRIARDLHDGLAQDLAFIAAHGARMARETGADHPLAIAAQRALAVSRGAIAELSGARAATVGEALHQVADELSSRFDIHVEVSVTPVTVTAADREDIVRIAREAIVNAARHGRARNIGVSLLADNSDRLILRVCDDGVGIGANAALAGGGYGFVSMRERAVALGGALTATTPATGGTKLELVVPS